MSTFIIKRLFNYQNKVFTTIAVRYEARQFVNDVRNFQKEYEELKHAEMVHDLHEFEDIQKHMEKDAGKAVKKAFAMFTHNMLILDKIVRTSKNALPNVNNYIYYLKTIEKRIPSTQKELRTKLESVQKLLLKEKGEIQKRSQDEMKSIYKRILNLIEAAHTVDSQTFMERMIETWKVDSARYMDYWMIRKDARGEIQLLSAIRKEREDLGDEIDDMHKKFNKGRITVEKLDRVLEHIIEKSKKIKDHIIKCFDYGYNMALRSIIVLFSMVKRLNELYRDDEKLAEEHQIPMGLANDMEAEIKDILKEIMDREKDEIKELHAVTADIQRVD